MKYKLTLSSVPKTRLPELKYLLPAYAGCFIDAKAYGLNSLSVTVGFSYADDLSAFSEEWGRRAQPKEVQSLFKRCVSRLNFWA